MTREDVAAKLAELREAGRKLRRRPLGEIRRSLEQVFDGWRDPSSSWRRELALRLPGATGFTAAMVRQGLVLGLENWGGVEWRALVSSELGAAEEQDTCLVSGFDVTAVVLAGSIPMPTLLSMLSPLALRSPVLAKPASRDPVTPRVVARSVAEIDPELGRCLEVLDVPRGDAMDALLGAECVIATGSDESVAELAARVTPTQRLLVAGHRLSVAAFGSELRGEESIGRAVAELAIDVAMWDQLGCLSPVALYCDDADGGRSDRIAAALAEALSEAEARWPRGRIERVPAAAVARERSEAEMRAATGRPVRLYASEGTRWTVVREDDTERRPAPLHRFLRVVPVAGPAALLDALRAYAPHLASVGIAGFGSASDSIARSLAELGASRICPVGGMQCPPLSWRHEGRDVLRPLARLADLEASPA